MTPTEWCPCIIVNSTAASGAFDGTYIITGHWFNRHWHWVQNDYTGVPSKEIYWELQGVFNGYWILVGTGGVYATYPATDLDKDTPPFGPSIWTVYSPGTVSGGSSQTFDLNCDTCVPTPSPSPAPTNMPTVMPTPSPSPSPTTTTYPTTMPTPSPSPSPTTTTYPTTMPTPSPSPSPYTSPPTPSPSPAPTFMPTTMPTPSPTQMPTTMPTPVPTFLPTVVPTPSPTMSPTVTCEHICVEDEETDPALQDTVFVGTYTWKNTFSPGNTKWRWVRDGQNGQEEQIYYNGFGNGARWIIGSSTPTVWMEMPATNDHPRPWPEVAEWLFTDGRGYRKMNVYCCPVTPEPTPSPTETPTRPPTPTPTMTPTIMPTPSPTIAPTHFCEVLNVTDSSGRYTGYYRMEPFMYNGKNVWRDPVTGESVYYADRIIFRGNEPPEDNIWLIGYNRYYEGTDSHFLVYDGADPNMPYPHLGQRHLPPVIKTWKDYEFNQYANKTSDVEIKCEFTDYPTPNPTPAPTDSPTKFCVEIFLWTCCDPVYTYLDGVYYAYSHKDGKDMWFNSRNGYYIYYNAGEDGAAGDSWSLKKWRQTGSPYAKTFVTTNGPYPPFEKTYWTLENFENEDGSVTIDLDTTIRVPIKMNCSDTFSPTSTPTMAPTSIPTTLMPSPVPTGTPSYLPTPEPTSIPTHAPSEPCEALCIEGKPHTNTPSKFDGTYNQNGMKNGKQQWRKVDPTDRTNTGDVYWIDRGVWAQTWIIRDEDGDYVMIYDENPASIHPPLDEEWGLMGGNLLHGEEYAHMLVVCCPNTDPPAPTPEPTAMPTCEGNAIYVEDNWCNVTNGALSGYYNYDRHHDDKHVYVKVDNGHEVIWSKDDLYADHWMIRPYDTDVCENYWVVHAPGTLLIPPEDAFWQAYGCACGEIKKRHECRFKVRCIHTKAPIPSPDPTPNPSPLPTPQPTGSPLTTPDPTRGPSPTPTSNPTTPPTPEPTDVPTTASPTQSPVPYDCIEIDMEPCTNWTEKTYPQRDVDKDKNNLKHWETKLYSEQKGYEFVATHDYALHEAGMAFINLASFHSIHVRVFETDSGDLLFNSTYQYGHGMTKTVGTPRGDYYTFRNMNVQLYEGVKYSIVFVVVCPHTQTMTAEYPLCAPSWETYTIRGFATDVRNVYQYTEVMQVPTDSDLYAPRIRVCYTKGSTDGPTPPDALEATFNNTALAYPPVEIMSSTVDGWMFAEPNESDKGAMILYDIEVPVHEWTVSSTVFSAQLWDVDTGTVMAVGTKVYPDTDGDYTSVRSFFGYEGVTLVKGREYVIAMVLENYGSNPSSAVTMKGFLQPVDQTPGIPYYIESGDLRLRCVLRDNGWPTAGWDDMPGLGITPIYVPVTVHYGFEE